MKKILMALFISTSLILSTIVPVIADEDVTGGTAATVQTEAAVEAQVTAEQPSTGGDSIITTDTDIPATTDSAITSDDKTVIEDEDEDDDADKTEVEDADKTDAEDADEAESPEDANAKLEAQRSVVKGIDPVIVEELRAQGFGYGQIAKIVALAKATEGTATVKTYQEVAQLVKDKAGFGKIAKELNLTVGQVLMAEKAVKMQLSRAARLQLNKKIMEKAKERIKAIREKAKQLKEKAGENKDSVKDRMEKMKERAKERVKKDKK